MTRQRRDERGQASVIIIGFALVVLLLVVVVVDAGAAYLKRQSLDSLADGAALYGADAAAEGRDVYSGGLGQDDLDLSADVARAAVRDYLRSQGRTTRTPACGSPSWSAVIGSWSRSSLRSTCRSACPAARSGRPWARPVRPSYDRRRAESCGPGSFEPRTKRCPRPYR